MSLNVSGAIAALVVAFASAPAIAANPLAPVPQMHTATATCAKVQATVRQSGAAVLHYGRQARHGLDGMLSGYGYDRVAADARYCLPRQSLTPIWVPTRDTPQCFAGYTCAEDDGWKNGRGRR